MDTPFPARSPRAGVSPRLWLSAACGLALAACASPGQPTPRSPVVPQAVADLAASRSGNAVVLTFTLPQETAEGRALHKPLAIEIDRDFEPLPASAGTSAPPAKVPAPLILILPEMTGRYSEQDHIRYTDDLQPADFANHPDTEIVYRVRTRVPGRKASTYSNAAALRAYPAPQPITDLKAEATQTSVLLSWTPPPATSAGLALPLSGYRIYRAAVEEAAPAGLTRPPAAGSSAAPPQAFLKVGDSESPSFRDAQVDFDATYIYSVRALARYSDETLESADSNLLTVSPRDLYVPAAPQGLEAVAVPRQGAVPAHLDLTWAVSSEAGIAGYNAYRSEQAGVPGTRVNTQLLLTPAFRDMNVVPGRRYFYTVTAVGRSGKESAPSAVVSGGVPADVQSGP